MAGFEQGLLGFFLPVIHVDAAAFCRVALGLLNRRKAEHDLIVELGDAGDLVAFCDLHERFDAIHVLFAEFGGVGFVFDGHACAIEEQPAQFTDPIVQFVGVGAKDHVDVFGLAIEVRLIWIDGDELAIAHREIVGFVEPLIQFCHLLG